VDDIARKAWVTPLAAATALSVAELIPSDQIWPVITAIERRSAARPRREATGGDPYRARISRLGPSYVSMVFQALDNEALSYPAASALLGMRVNHLRTLREKLAARTSHADGV
jgi:hypothetical protein